MKKRKHEITGFGIFCIVVLGIIMIAHFYMKLEDKLVYERILEGALRFGMTFLCAGLIYLAFTVGMYAMVKLSEVVFSDEGESENLLDYFLKVSNPVFLACYIAAYVLIFLEY